MTHPLRPKLPRRVAGLNRDRAATYAGMIRALDLLTGDEAMALAVDMVGLVSESPRVAMRMTALMWAEIRVWHVGRPDNTRNAGGVECSCCGERRLTRMTGEGTIVQHTTICALIPSGSLSVPSIAKIEPIGCSHQTFAVICNTCGTEIGMRNENGLSEFRAVLASPPLDGTEIRLTGIDVPPWDVN